MSKTLIIHDVDNLADNLGLNTEKSILFYANSEIKSCIGCFHCWIKTPGKCVIKDKAYELPKLISTCNRMIVISENYYGGYSPHIKRVFDRSIGYILPFFRIVNNEMHHVMRYDNPFSMEVYFYGKRISEREKELARDIIKANALNLGAAAKEAHFYTSVGEMKGLIE